MTNEDDRRPKFSDWLTQPEHEYRTVLRRAGVEVGTLSPVPADTTITVKPEFGDTVQWRDAGTVITGRVTFVGEFTVRVVPTGESDQAWRWIDVADIVADEPIPGQLDLFAGLH